MMNIKPFHHLRHTLACRFLLFATFAVVQPAALSLVAQTSTTPYLPGVTNEGAVYFLPRTALRISVLVERTAYEPGDYAAYAQRYLRLQDVSQKASVSHRVVGIRQTTFGEADPTKAFAVKFNANTVASNVALTEDGRLIAINAETVPEITPRPFVPAERPERPNPRTFMNEEILAAGSKAKMAELTSREIYDLRENRSLLIKGQADYMPKDGQQLKLMLAQIETQETALRSLFEGTTTCDTTEHIITFLPEKPVARQVLFRLSQEKGLVEADDLTGEPFYITIDNLNVLPPTDEEAAAKGKKKVTDKGVYVNVPGRVRSTIHHGIDQVAQAEFPCAQFGNVELLSADLFNKRYTTQVWISPVTGALEQLQADIKQ